MNPRSWSPLKRFVVGSLAGILAAAVIVTPWFVLEHYFGWAGLLAYCIFTFAWITATAIRRQRKLQAANRRLAESSVPTAPGPLDGALRRSN
jgi:hypothetical protein